MPRLDHIRQFYADGGYIKPAKRNPAEAVARVRAGLPPRLKMDVAGSVAQQVQRQGLLPLLRFTKNFVGNLNPVQQRALDRVAQHARETGKESLIYGRLPGTDPVTGSAQRGVTKPIVYGDKDSVALPPSYFRFLRSTQDDPGQLWTAHAHPGARSSAVPSDIMGDLGVAMNRGQGSLLFDQDMKPTSGPWQHMLITSPASNTAVKLDPMSQMFTGPNARLGSALDIRGDAKLKELLGGGSIYGETLDDMSRRMAALKDWSGAHGIDLPSLRDWSTTRSSSPPMPTKEAWMPFQQSQSARMYDALGHYGVGAEMDWKAPFANTDVTQREALPSFLNYWRRFSERPSDADYGLSSAIPERQLGLGLARGGRPGFATTGWVAPARKYAGQLLSRYRDPAAELISDWAWKPLSKVAKSLGENLPTELPPHVREYGDFMRRQANMAGDEGLAPRDVLKAYTTTLASIQRQARDRALFPGVKLSTDEQMVRPEGVFADWLGGKMGQKYLDYGAQGEAHPEAIADVVQKLHSFGLMPSLGKRMEAAPGIVQGTEGPLSEAVWRASRGHGDPSEWSDVMSPFAGIGPAKKGFMGSMIGYGGKPTLDARQLNLHTYDPDLLDKFGARGGGRGAEEAVQRLAARQNALNMFVPPEYQPFDQHLMHHAYWDAVSGTKTPHSDLMDMMENRARGGRIGFDIGGAASRAAQKLILPTFQEALRYGKDAALKGVHQLMPERRILEQIAEHTGWSEQQLDNLLRTKSKGVRGDTTNFTGWSGRKGGPEIYNEATGLFVPQEVERNWLTPLDVYGKDNYGVMGMSDRTRALARLKSVNGIPLNREVEGMGGSDFPYTQRNRAPWASDPAALLGMHTALHEPESEMQQGLKYPITKDSNIFFLNKMMGSQAGDQSHQNLDTLTQLLQNAPMTGENRAEFDRLLRPWKYGVAGKQVNVFPDWPGSDKPAAEQMRYLQGLPMSKRAALMKFMDQSGVQALGGPDPTAIRMMTTDPALFGAPEGSVGRSVSRLDPHNPFDLAPERPHPDYPANFGGTYLGSMAKPLPARIAAPDWWAKVRTKADPLNPTKDDMASFRTSPVVQRFDQEWLDQAMKWWEANPQGWTPKGNARGGRPTQRDYELYHVSQWQEPFAEGGKVAFPVQSRRRDYEQYHVLNNWEDDPGGWW
jgi:hypothetical protein